MCVNQIHAFPNQIDTKPVLKPIINSLLSSKNLKKCYATPF